MASISKFSTALLSVPNEITVAAANFNLNFSLMKVEAPPEFHGLRDALSQARRREAEEGTQHVTARCLGALFEAIIPPIPHLSTAYGKRVSELSGQLQSPQLAGMFADRAGADGTSIWAAATSGQHALAMHLLSCMLSRIWKPAEATSLWVELVERRKQEILNAYSDSTATGISSIMAAQQSITRDQLAAWDASTRAWLQSADATKRIAQTQLMLIINNARMPVNAKKDPYVSVIDAWKSGMNTMERLICGTPQRVQDGSILLAMSSWHLYPNMQVLSDCTKDIDFGDELMACSMLTISTFGTSDDRDGVFWSLPLSRMRYYSPPVVSERNIASDTSRISMEEFHVVFLGSFVGQWRSICNDEVRCCRFIISLQETYNNASSNTPAWFQLLAAAASRILNASGHLRAQYHKLLKLGSRRCGGFIHDPAMKPPAFFGLENFYNLVRTVGNTEDCIRLLRRAGEARKTTAQATVIRYANRHQGGGFHFASSIPQKRGSYKRPADQTEDDCARESDEDDICAGCFNQMEIRRLEEEGEEYILLQPDSLDEFDQQQFKLRRHHESKSSWYGLWLGNESIAAVFRVIDFPSCDSYCPSNADLPSATIEEIESAISSTSFNPSEIDLETCCGQWTGLGHEQMICSLEALLFATNIYGSMKDSTVSIEVMNSPMYECSWSLPSMSDHGPLRLRAFACIAWFDSGEFNIAMKLMKGVMALANGDSIYVASGLLADPSTTTYDVPVRRVFGNLGRSELCLLVPPADPRLAEPDLRSWQHVNHCDFDGQFQDCFTSTSLHLSFTDSEDTMYLGNRGLRDRQVVFVEALVSIDDRGRNIGDLDIMAMFGKDSLCVQEKCPHSPEQRGNYRGQVHEPNLTALDCWEEFLDPPQTTAIFRAAGNWQARLGAAAAATQMGKQVLVLPTDPCLYCLGNLELPEFEVIIA
ncbi:hypothetical protein FB567DRAFT_447277 [Paraphoma chrysanthemicola]|uniref:Uncharacterized protein n=1 Tax=Paraphoma chrysanthemicola TaxID=798071 RepID=A0A8K0R3A7_9PLEO|nr:hypothetical protein FB567DRAFT_447277 [Paraphoma chrysanthemicola]